MYSFEEFTLDTGRRELRRGSALVTITPQVFDLLLYLVHNRERVVSKDDLIASIWNGRVVSESALTMSINAARSAVDDTGEEQRLIRTLPRRGLRFVGAVFEAQQFVASTEANTLPRQGNALSLPDKPSIAVLPFTNLSGDPEQDYFADGIVEEIITALSRFSGLFVIARNSSFTYKGRAVDVKQVGRELGVRYVLEGSLRKAANRVRITGQLIDTSTGAHIWADRFDGALNDIFDLQDQITATVVATISPKLEQAEIERIKHKPTESLDAYDCLLRGMAIIHELAREPTDEALKLFGRAIRLDADFAPAYGMATWCYVQRKANRWMNDFSQEVAETSRLARRAVSLGKQDAVALSRAGHAFSYVACDLESGVIFVERALALNPNLAFAWFARAWNGIWLGQPEKALQNFAHVVRLSPLDPLMPSIHAGMALGHFVAAQYDEAATLAGQVLREKPELHLALRVAAASNALAGHMQEAQEAMIRLRGIDPTLRVFDLKVLTPFRQVEYVARYEDGLRKAGLPE